MTTTSRFQIWKDWMKFQIHDIVPGLLDVITVVLFVAAGFILTYAVVGGIKP